MRFAVKAFAFCGCSMLSVSSVLVAKQPSAMIAMIGAEATGTGYEYALRCGADDALLRAFKAKKLAFYANAGPAFEQRFMAGRSEASKNWNELVHHTGSGSVICDNGKFVAHIKDETGR